MHHPPSRILVVADEYPWPPTNGYRMRLANVVGALGDVGTVDALWVSSDVDRAAAVADAPVGLLGRSVTVLAVRRTRGAAVLGWLLGRLPRRVVWLDWRAARRAAATFAGPYDLIWYSHADTWLALHRSLPDARTIVDLDNLEDHKLAQRRKALADVQHPRPLRRRLRHAASIAADLLDERRWARQQRRAASASHAVAVCSELDRQRLGVTNAAVVPNGYDPPGDLPARSTAAPTVTMIGLMTYEPNSDGARFFVDEALPHLRERIPGAELRLVGRHDGSFDDLAGRDGVVVTGEVERIEDELGQADVLVVPLRFGGGTRLKVLEGFASRIPVVSTSIGCEGLGAIPGEHLLVADDGPGLADACARLLQEPELRRAVTEQAYRLFDSSYRWGPISEQVGALAAPAPEATGTAD